MDTLKLQTITGALLHDVGKVALRAGAGEKRQNHSSLGASLLQEILKKWPESGPVLDCIRCHHGKALTTAGLPSDSPAWIVYEADNIAAGTDRRARPAEGDVAGPASSFRSTQCLDNVFNLVRTPRKNIDTHQEFKLIYGLQEENQWIAPHEAASGGLEATPAQYAEIWNGLYRALAGVEWGNPGYLNSIHSILEGFVSYVPSSTASNEVADISLFDHSVMTAAVAACILDWATEQKIQSYKELCFDRPDHFRRQPIFLIVHADLSGIQDFIYTISSKRALKSLRGRSFYLEILMEQVADEILSQLGLTRSNLLYTGGGGFYLILPNTKRATDVLRQASNRFNTWLRDQFSIDLYLGLAWTEASAAHFMDLDKDSPGSKEVFRAVARELSTGKMQRYRGNGLADLFIPERPEQGDRECAVCGRSSRLVDLSVDNPAENMTICTTCRELIGLGSQLIADRNAAADDKLQFVVTSVLPGSGSLKMPLPALDGEAWLTLQTTRQLRETLRNAPERVIRIYSKNHRSAGLEVSTRLWVGDYNFCAINQGGAVEFKDFVDMRGDEGIGRIAVLRADVDNLGSLFSGGFRGDNPDKSRYETLGRYATLSRSLSRFFKNQINQIASEKQRNLVLVYAGGDDIFAVGAWDEMIDFALDLREKFARVTGDKLSFSAGIGFFRHNFPISRMAEMTGELEAMAKRGAKNQVALFGVTSTDGVPACHHVYDWQRLKDGVLPKEEFLLNQIRTAGTAKDAEEKTGLSFLYKVHELLLEAETETAPDRSNASDAKPQKSLSLARLAYLIARREPPAGASPEAREQYAELRDKLYHWATDPVQRQELITAIMLTVYTMRKKGE